MPRKSPPLLTVCRKGLHPFTEDNCTYYNGHRRCRACIRLSKRRQVLRNRKTQDLDPEVELVRPAEIPHGFSVRPVKGFWPSVMRRLSLVPKGHALKIDFGADYLPNLPYLYETARAEGVKFRAICRNQITYLIRTGSYAHAQGTVDRSAALARVS